MLLSMFFFIIVNALEVMSSTNLLIVCCEHRLYDFFFAHCSTLYLRVHHPQMRGMPRNDHTVFFLYFFGE